MTQEALHDFVLLKPIEIEKPKSEIILTPDVAKTISPYCEILSIGEEVEGFEVGDIVYCSLECSAHEWEDEDGELFLLACYRDIPMRFTDVKKAEEVSQEE